MLQKGAACCRMSDFAAALLAGGHSRRMGTDKAFLQWQGRPLWEHQLEKLRALAPSRLLLSCRAEQEIPALADVQRVHDEWENSGPLGGVASCLHACEAPRLVVLGVDLPHLPAEFLRTLLAQSTDECGAAVRVADYYEPLAAVYPRAMLALAEEQLSAGRLAMQDFIRRGVERGLMRCMDLPSPRAWFSNWNTPEDVSPDAPAGDASPASWH